MKAQPLKSFVANHASSRSKTASSRRVGDGPAAAMAAAQMLYYGQAHRVEAAPGRDEPGSAEAAFIAARDSFCMSTASEAGWPHIQHRGGPAGFLHVRGPSSLAFADFRGDRQLLSTGNVAASDRVALFPVDYPQRSRLKILGHARVVAAREHPDLAKQLAAANMLRVVERRDFIEVVSHD